MPYHRKPLDMILIWATKDGISDNQARSFVGWSYFLNSSARLFIRKMPVFVDLKIKIVYITNVYLVYARCLFFRCVIARDHESN